MIFDLLYLDGDSLLDADYATRRRRLEELQLEGDAWRVPPTLDGAAEDVLAASRAAGLEGIIAKRSDSPYKPGYRGREWLKIKNVLRQEFVIGGYTAGSGRRADSIGALLVGYHRDGELHYAGKVGTGYSDADLAMLTKRLRPLARKRSPFARRDAAPGLGASSSPSWCASARSPSGPARGGCASRASSACAKTSRPLMSSGKRRRSDPAGGTGESG